MTWISLPRMAVLENFLQNFGVRIITVSHDRYFLDKVASKIGLALAKKGAFRSSGNYAVTWMKKAFEAAQVTASHKLKKKPVRPRREETHELLGKAEWASSRQISSH